jgi:hypothetical protein
MTSCGPEAKGWTAIPSERRDRLKVKTLGKYYVGQCPVSYVFDTHDVSGVAVVLLA